MITRAGLAHGRFNNPDTLCVVKKTSPVEFPRRGVDVLRGPAVLRPRYFHHPFENLRRKGVKRHRPRQTSRGRRQSFCLQKVLWLCFSFPLDGQEDCGVISLGDRIINGRRTGQRVSWDPPQRRKSKAKRRCSLHPGRAFIAGVQ